MPDLEEWWTKPANAADFLEVEIIRREDPDFGVVVLDHASRKFDARCGFAIQRIGSASNRILLLRFDFMPTVR